MRVALVSRYFLPYQVGGIEFHVHNLSNELACLGHDVHVYTSTDNAITTNLVEPREDKNKSYTVHYLRSKLGIITPDLKDFDLIHIHEYFRMLTNYLVLRWTSDKPIVLTLHGGTMGPYHERQHGVRKYAKIYHDRFFLPIISDRLEKIITVTQIEKQLLLNQFKLSTSKVTVIPNGIPSDAFDRKDDEPRIISSPYLLTISRIAKIKSLGHVIQVLPMMSEEIHYVIAGPDDGELCNLKRLASSYGVEDRVHFVGSVFGAKKYALLSNAFAFVLPSSFEAQPTVLIEAMAQGLPVIASNVGGVSEIINEKTGMLYDYGNLKDLQRKIEYCYINKRSTQDTGARNECLRNIYSWKEIAKRITGIYCEAISKWE